MPKLHDNRWAMTEDDFAERLDVRDIEGFFSKTITIDPGVRAVFLEEGRSIGEVGPGAYTLQTFVDRLQFWKRNRTTIFVMRKEPQALDVRCSGLRTSEPLQVEAHVRLAVQLDDAQLFLENVMGPRETFSREQLLASVRPVVEQALWDATGKMSIRDLAGPTARRDLEAAVTQALAISFPRKGLRFGGVQTISIAHPEYDAQRRRTGEIWLQRQSLELDGKAREIEAAARLAEIERTEKLDDLEILAQHVAADRTEGDLAVEIRRIGLRQRLREEIQTGDIERIKTEEEMRAFLRERDKSRLLSDEEHESLIAAVRDRMTDRDSSRAHLLRRLEVERAADLQRLRNEFDHAHKMGTLSREIEFAKTCDSESSRRWIASLEREAKDAEHRRAERAKQLADDRAQARSAADSRRDEEFAEMLHRQRAARIDGEIRFESAERSRRVQELDSELGDTRRRRELELEEMRREIEREQNTKDQSSLLDRQLRLQQMNMEFQRHELELHERRSRLESDLSIARDDRVASRERERLELMRSMSLDQILVLSGQTTAWKDVTLGKSADETKATIARAELDAKARIADAEARARAAEAAAAGAGKQEVIDHLKRENERVREDARRGEDRGDKSLASTQDFAKSMAETLASTAKAFAGQTPPTAPAPIVVVGGTASHTPSPSDPAVPNAPRKVVCRRCRMEVDASAKFCPSCAEPM